MPPCLPQEGVWGDPGHWLGSRRIKNHLYQWPRELSRSVSNPRSVERWQGPGRIRLLLARLWSFIPRRPWAIMPLPLVSVSPSRWRRRLQGPLSAPVSWNAVHTGLALPPCPAGRFPRPPQPPNYNWSATEADSTGLPSLPHPHAFKNLRLRRERCMWCRISLWFTWAQNANVSSHRNLLETRLRKLLFPYLILLKRTQP